MFAPTVHVRGDRAYVEAPGAIRFQVEVGAVPGDLVSYARLNYRLERRTGVWRILSLDAVYELAERRVAGVLTWLLGRAPTTLRDYVERELAASAATSRYQDRRATAEGEFTVPF